MSRFPLMRLPRGAVTQNLYAALETSSKREDMKQNLCHEVQWPGSLMFSVEMPQHRSWVTSHRGSDRKQDLPKTMTFTTCNYPTLTIADIFTP